MLNPLRIGSRLVGDGQPAVVAAEIGINHGGSVSLAREMVHAAAEAGADSVKFQAYRVADFLLTDLPWQGRSQQELFASCELSWDALADLKSYAESYGLLFHATPMSVDGVHHLREMGCLVLKNGSDALQHHELIRAMGESGLPTVISTGMANEGEIHAAVRTYQRTRNSGLILLHCTSRYPTPLGLANLGRIVWLQDAFACPVGFSDHTAGVTAAIAARTLGACWIEKHFTTDKALPGPDQPFSADPAEMNDLVHAIRGVEAALTEPEDDGQAEMREVARLSCVAAIDLPKGHVLLRGDIAFSRPGTGLPPSEVDRLVGRGLRWTIKTGQVLTLESVCDPQP